MRTTALVLAVLLIATLSVHAAESMTFPGAFTVTRPGAAWVFEKAQDGSIGLEQPDVGIGVVLRWVANPAGLPSDRLARQLRHRMMESPAWMGRHFSTMKTAKLGPEPAACFTVEMSSKAGAVHRTSYTVAAHGKGALIVAVMGGAVQLEKHAADIARLLEGIRYE